MTPDKTALVTGGVGGIGAAVCSTLLAAGWEVWSLDLAAHPNRSVRSLICDVTDPAALTDAAERAGRIDALVTAAGINLRPADNTLARMTPEAWHTTLAVNLTGTMMSVRHFADRIAVGGSIVTLGSIGALRALPGSDAYTASKGAVVALSRVWAVELGARQIRVNCVCPGLTDTAMLDDILGSLPGRQGPDLPQQRPAEPQEVAAVIAFLLSDAASYLSGAIIPVDGGASAHGAGMPFPRVHRDPG